MTKIDSSLWFKSRSLKLKLLFRPSSRSSILFRDGYESVKNANDLNLLRSFVNSVAKDLASQLLNASTGDSEQVVIKKGVRNFQVQKLFTNIFAGDFLTRSYIASKIGNSKLWFPLSRKMRLQARCQGIPISRFVCQLLWVVYKLRITAAMVTGELFRPYVLLEAGKNQGSCLYVADAGLDPSDPKQIQQLSKFATWFDKMPCEVSEKIWPPTKATRPPAISSEDSFLVRVFKEDLPIRLFFALLISIDSLVSPRILRELLMFIIEKLLSGPVIKRIKKRPGFNDFYLIPSNSGVVRPIWTYLHQFLGSEFLYIQLSHAVDPNPFEGELLDLEVLNTWGITYSPKVITTLNLNVFQKPIPKGWTRIPEWSLQTALPDTVEIGVNKYVSVFDIEPQKDWYGISTLNEVGYDKVDVVSGFLQTILEEAFKANFVVLHKPKRNIGAARLADYTKLLHKLIEEYPSHYILIPADVSPVQIISRSKGTISMPCTSTAIIAQDIGSPTVFFDCTNLINPSDQAAAGIKVLQDRHQLSSWITSLS